MSKYGVVAKLVWDGTDEVRIPVEMGTPATSQMHGTAIERLSEVSGRVCYDSLGRGRSSEEFHKHILEVKHLSVYGHGAVTVRIQGDHQASLMAFLNRPGVWVDVADDCRGYRVTLNPRALLDWQYWTSLQTNITQRRLSEWARRILMARMSPLCPMVLGVYNDESELFQQGALDCSSIVDPESDEEKWVSLFVSGSRGMSHELVRHGFRSGISQRSTRYVDEDGSPWLDHPLVQEYLASAPDEDSCYAELADLVTKTKKVAKAAYKCVADELQRWLLKRGIDKFTSRKQARGAARGYLGNALVTELVFSASVAQWKRILRQRLNDAADAEIRAVAASALPELKSSRYGDCFKSFNLVPSIDGIGHSSVEEKPTVAGPSDGGGL